MKKDDRLLITSTQNPRIRTLRSLQKRRGRDESGLMVIEGIREVRRALSSGIVPVEAYVCTAVADAADGRADHENKESLQELTEGLLGLGTDIHEVNTHVYGKIAYRETSEGVIVVATRPATSIDALEATGTPLILVVDGIEKPGNLGAIIRTADGAGVTGIIVCGGVDAYSPNVIRASVGTVFAIGIA
ncbi:MAG TPA: RNA methyltransferase, partial [Candidatus Krumholzibacterium sp.]|nr:RNA methyltransferase [Candidatus Krumholzibacterium sp.]